MKISPVVGTPTIPVAPPTGNSPEKLARLKAIAAGEGTIAVSEVPDERAKVTAPAPATITMKTTQEADKVVPEQIEVPAEDSAISDDNVQANAVREVTQPLSPQSAALAKQRRALQVKERELADREKSLAGPTRAELEAKIKSQPLSVLQELGVTYDQLTNDILAAQGGSAPEIQALKAEVKALRDGIDKTFSDKDAATEKAVIADIRRTVDKLCFSGDDFELIRETRSQPDVLELIRRTYKTTGELLDEVDAMRLVEGELVKDAEKIAKLKKVQGRLNPAPLQQQPLKQQGMRTLTNKDSAKPVMGRRERAILAAQGTLKR